MNPLGTLMALIAVVLLSACGRTDTRTPIVVLAASSLSAVFTTLEQQYETSHPGVDVQVSTAGSQTLRTQIEQGLRGDIFASADPSHIAALHEAQLSEPMRALAANHLVIAVPADSTMRTADQLPRAGRIVIGTTAVPIGRYTRRFLQRVEAEIPGFQRKVESRIVSEEPNVRLTLAKVQLGQADAAVVYRTDTMGPTNRGIRTVEIPEKWQVTARYGMSLLKESQQRAQAAQFMAWLGSSSGQGLLTSAGFQAGQAQ
ncbi:MAG: molybdate ABC transporter substrate-binding protein [Myxococcales bacterium]|nr:molybdate ABC transporter substrate-binding protein [Myxococcales bacterium]